MDPYLSISVHHLDVSSDSGGRALACLHHTPVLVRGFITFLCDVLCSAVAAACGR